MAKHKPPVTEDDIALFRNEAGAVRPIRHNQHEYPSSRPLPIARQWQRDELQTLNELLEFSPSALDVESGEELRFSRDGVSPRQLAKLRRGHYVVEAELDLHGLTLAAAEQALREFLAYCQSRRLRCVRIVHGKGLRSPAGRPVIKPLVNQWLQRRADIIAFVSARTSDGGTGAVYVLRKLI